MGRIFISYRREDAEGFAGRVYDWLERSLGKQRVFMDEVHTSILPGTDFPSALENELNTCDALMAIIGPRWLTSTDERRKRRIDDPKDWVRHEIAVALGRGILVIPVLFGGVGMPKAEQLPQDIRKLSDREAWDFGVKDFPQKIAELAKLIEQALREAERKRAADARAEAAREKAKSFAEYKAMQFPLRPYQYPIWVLFLCGAVFASAVASISYLPDQLGAAAELDKANQAREEHKWDQAVALYHKLLAENESSKEAKLGLALSLFSRGQGTDNDDVADLIKGFHLSKDEMEKLAAVAPAAYRCPFLEKSKVKALMCDDGRIGAALLTIDQVKLRQVKDVVDAEPLACEPTRLRCAARLRGAKGEFNVIYESYLDGSSQPMVRLLQVR